MLQLYVEDQERKVKINDKGKMSRLSPKEMLFIWQKLTESFKKVV